MSDDRDDSQRVTLYRLQRRLKLHRDTLERLCMLRSIPILVVEGKRCIRAGDLERLRAAAEEHRERVRPWGD